MYIVDAVYDLYVVGGYKDDAAKAEKLTQRFFRHLHDLTIRYTHIFMLVKIPFISKCLSAHKKKYGGIVSLSATIKERRLNSFVKVFLPINLSCP